jgi:uncharacterized protein (DUF1330 family)
MVQVTRPRPFAVAHVFGFRGAVNHIQHHGQLLQARGFVVTGKTEDSDTDGIVVLWFDNIDGFNAFANSPSYLNVIKLDEERFADPKKCEYFFSEERTIIK